MTEPAQAETKAPGFLSDLWSLGKPRLSSLVLFTAGGSMYLAGGSPSMSTVIAGILGTTMVVCSANSLNNYLERETDKLMERTRTRPLPTGRLAPWIAVVYGVILMAIAVPWMLIETTPLATGLAVLAWVIYVFVYTPEARSLAQRRRGRGGRRDATDDWVDRHSRDARRWRDCTSRSCSSGSCPTPSPSASSEKRSTPLRA